MARREDERASLWRSHGGQNARNVEFLEDRTLLASVTITGGASSSWDLRDDVATSNGLPTGGSTSIGAAGSGAAVGDASLSSQGDAFDFGGMVWVNNTLVGGVLTQNGNTVNFAPVTIAGLNVSMQYYVSSDTATLRTLVSLQNPTSSTVTVPVQFGSNWGSDGSTTTQKTTDGDTIAETTDRWIITDDSVTGGDPAITTALFGPNSPPVTPDSVSTTVFDNAGTQGLLASFSNVSIGAGQTRSLMFFHKLNDTSANAISSVGLFNNDPYVGSDLLRGLSLAQIRSIINWNTNERPTLTSNGGALVAEVSGGNIVVRNGSTVLLSAAPSEAPQSIVITGHATLADTLTVDFTNGNPLPFGGLTFNAGGGTDSIVLMGGTTTAVTHSDTNNLDGSVALAGAVSGTINYTGTEALTDGVIAVNRVFTFNGGLESISITDGTANDGKFLIDSSLGAAVSAASPTGMLTINAGAGNDVIDVTGFDANFSAGLTVNGGLGNDTVTILSNINLGSNSLDVDLQNDESAPGTDTITIGSLTTATGPTITSKGAGSITLKASKTVAIGSASRLTTENGNITIEANQQATASTGGFQGVKLLGTALVDISGTGNLTVKGKGGTDAGGGQVGVQFDGGTIRGSASGTTTIVGAGGVSAGHSNAGVLLRNSAATITSLGGNVSVTGTGGGGTSSNSGRGVWITSGTITAGGTGSVTVVGNGASGSGGYHFGVNVSGGSITSSGGTVSVTGTGNGSGAASYGLGVMVGAGGTITSGGNGSVTVTGNAGTGTSGNHTGVRLEGGGVIGSGGTGSLTITGKGSTTASGNNNLGVHLTNTGSKITSAGNIIINGTGGGTGTSSYNGGVWLETGTSIAATGDGTLSVTGKAGASTTATTRGALGVQLVGTARITSEKGSLSVTGTGGGAGATSNYNHGVVVEAGTKLQSLSGNVSVTGTGGASGGGSNFGVYVTGTGALIASDSGAVTVTGKGGSASTQSRNVGVQVDASGAITTASGNLSVVGKGSSVAAAGYQYGVLMSAAKVTSSYGQIMLDGTGGDSSMNAEDNYGIWLNGGTVVSTGTGSIALTGKGGTGGNDGEGVRFDGSTTMLTTNGGNISIIGQGGGNGTSSSSQGIAGVCAISTSGTGAITLQGTPGGGSGGYNDGVALYSTSLSSQGAAISISGRNGSATGDIGVFLDPTVSVTSNNGPISFVADRLGLSTGTTTNKVNAGTGTLSLTPLTAGVAIDLGSTVDTTANTLEVSTTELGRLSAGKLVIGDSSSGAITFSQDVTLTSVATLDLTTNASINSTKLLTVPTLSLTASAGIGSVSSPFSMSVNSLTTNSGGANGNQYLREANSLTVRAGGLNAGTGSINFTSGTVNAGGAGAGVSAGSISVPSGVTLGGIGTVAGPVAVSSGGSVAPGASPGALTTGNISFATGANFNVELNGTAVGTGYDQLNVNGTVDLGGANLVVSVGFSPTLGDQFVIVNNDGTDAVTGTLKVAGVTIADEGSFVVSGKRFYIDYNGGSDANDVVLTFKNNPITASVVGNDIVIEDTDGTKNNQLTLVRNGSNFEISDANERFLNLISGAKLLNDEQTVQIPVSALGAGGKIIVRGQGGNDTLTIDGSKGGWVPVEFDAGSGSSDALVLAADAVTSVAHTLSSLTGGSLTVVDGSSNLITLTGVDSLTDNLTAVDRSFTFTNAADTVTVSDGTTADGKTTIALSGGRSLNVANPTGSLTLNADAGNDVVTVSSVDVAYGASLIINGGAGNDVVFLIGDITFASGKSLDVNLVNDASAGDVDAVTVGNDANLATTGAGTFDLRASQAIFVASGASLSVQDAGLTLEANATGTLAVDVSGVRLQGIVESTGSGAISITGKGGDHAATNGHLGVSVETGGQVRSTGTGNISITGEGGDGINSNIGVYVDTGSVTSKSGNIQVTGTGAGTGTYGTGVYVVAGGSIASTSTGKVSVSGTATASGIDHSEGVFVIGANSKIAAVDGDLTVIGVGRGAAGASQIGVNVNNSGQIVSTGKGKLTVTGTGGSGASSNMGVSATSGGQIVSTGSGDVLIQGTGGSGTTGNNGVYVVDNGSKVASGTGALQITGTGGTGTGNFFYGVFTSSNATITSGGGNVSVTGVGGGGASSGSGRGVWINGGTVSAGGMGTVTVTGTGSNTSGGYNFGVDLRTATITSNGGAVTVTGTGSGTYGLGVTVGTGGIITSGNNGGVTVTGVGGAGTAGYTEGVTVQAGGLITANGTGSVNVTGTASAASSTNINIGVRVIDAGSTITSGGGDITISGIGGGTSTTSDNYGVIVQNGGDIIGGGGTTTITGKGGNGVNNNFGIIVGDSGSTVESATGKLVLNGTGGSGSGYQNVGIRINPGAVIRSTGTGDTAANVTLTGNGATGAIPMGIQMVSGTISTIDGDLTITGKAGNGVGNFAIGVDLYQSAALIESTGTGANAGKISITGTGGDGTDYSIGVDIEGGTVRSVDGDVQVSGTASDTTGNSHHGVVLEASGKIQTTGAANVSILGQSASSSAQGFVMLDPSTITLTGSQNSIAADTIKIATTSGVAISATGKEITFKPKTAGRAMNIGSTVDTTANTVELSVAELGRVSAGTLSFGDATTGTVTIAAAPTFSNLSVTSGVNSQFNVSLTAPSNGNITLNGLATLGGVTLTTSGTGAVVLNGDLALSGSTASTIAGGLSLPAGTHALNVTDVTGNSNDDLIVSAVISGAGGFTKNGTGTLKLSGANTYSGETTVNAGSVGLYHGSALGSAAGGTVLNGGNTSLQMNGIAVSAEPLTLYSTSSGSRSYLNPMTGTNSWGGPITVSGADGITGIEILGTGTTVSVTGDISTAANSANHRLQIRGSATTSGTAAGKIDVPYLDKVDYNTWTLAASGNHYLALGIGGTLRMAAANALDPTAPVTVFVDPTLDMGIDLNGFSQTIKSAALYLNAAPNSKMQGFTSATPATLTFSSDADSNFPGDIQGKIALVKSGTGTLTLASGNTYDQGTTVTGGSLLVSADTALGAVPATATANITLNGGGLKLGASFDPNLKRNIVLGANGGTLDSNGFTSNFEQVISGAGALTLNGSGTINLRGNNTYSGVTTINAGTVALHHTNALGAASAGTVLTGNNAVLALLNNLGTINEPLTLTGISGTSRSELRNTAGTTNWAGPITLAGSNGNIDISGNGGALTISGNVTDTTTNSTTLWRGNGNSTLSGNLIGGSFIKTDDGTWTLSGSGNTFGTLNIGRGTVRMGAENTLPATARVIVSHNGSNIETLDLNGFSQTVASIEVNSGAPQFTNQIIKSTTPATLTVNGSASTTYHGTIEGSVSLVRSGTGTLTLSGSNTYTGTTTVSSGTLNVASSLPAASTVTVSGTGILAGTGTAGPVSAQSGGTVAAGNGTSSTSAPVSSVAGKLQPASYDIPNGQLGGDVPNFFDDTYTGSGAKTTPLAPLTGGLGDLTDGVIATGGWGSQHVAYVGWAALDPTLTFRFPNNVTLTNVRFYFDDAEYGGVDNPAGVTISSGGKSQSASIADPAGNAPFVFDFPVSLTGSTFDIVPQRNTGRWVMLSEVQFTGLDNGAAATFPGILNTGNLGLADGSNLAIEIAGLGGAGTATGHDQLNVTGSVTLSGGNLVVTAPPELENGDTFVIINNDGTDAVNGQLKANGKLLGEGGEFFIGDDRFVISYAGGTGNDVVIKVQNVSTFVSIDANGNLVIEDGYGGTTNDNITLKSDTTNNVFVLEDISGIGTEIPGATGVGSGNVTIPFSAVTGGKIFINTYAGNDTVTIDDALGLFSKSLYVDGGTATTTDKLIGKQSTATAYFSGVHTMTGPTSGSMSVTHNSNVLSVVNVTYTGVEAVNDGFNLGQRFFDTQTDATTITVTDAVGAATTFKATSSPEITFANTRNYNQFTNFGKVDAMTITSFDAASTAGLSIYEAEFLGRVRINGALSLSSLSVEAETLEVNSKVAVTGAPLINAGKLSLLAGSSLSSAQGVTLFVNDLVIDTSANPASLIASTGGVSWEPLEGGRSLIIGGTDPLALTDAELDRISGATISIGGSNSTSTISINGAISHAGDKSITVNSRRNIVFGPGSSWTTTNGNLAFNANVGGDSTGNFKGIDVNGATIKALGNGAITLLGKGGVDAANGNDGVTIRAAGQVVTNGTGTLRIEGWGGGTGASDANVGVRVTGTGSKIVSTKDGSTAQTGHIQLVGAHGSGANSVGISVESAGAISTGGTATGTGGTASASFTADRTRFDATAVINTGSYSVSFAPKTTGLGINVGSTGDNSATALELSDTELDRVTAGTLQIGSFSSGPVVFSAAITRNVDPVHLHVFTNSSPIEFAGGSWTSAGHQVYLKSNTGAVTADASGIDIIASYLQVDAGLVGTDNNPLRVNVNNLHLVEFGTNSNRYLSEADTANVEVATTKPLTSNGVVSLKNGQFTLGIFSNTTDKLTDTMTLELAPGVTLTLNGKNETIGGLTGAGTIVGGSTTASTLTVNSATDSTFSGVLGGTGTNHNNFALKKQGAGNLTLSGNNTYIGATTIEGGTLTAASGSALGAITGNTTVAAGGTLALVGSVLSEPLSIAGTGAGGGGAVRNVSGNSSLAGAITVADGALITSEGSLALNGAINTNGKTLTLNSNNNNRIDIAGVISGAGGLTKTGSGTLTLSGTNTYTGLTRVDAGTVEVRNAAALGTAAGGTAVADNASLVITTAATINEPLQLQGNGVDGNGALVGYNGAVQAGPITLTGNAGIGSASKTTLFRVTGAITDGGTNSVVRLRNQEADSRVELAGINSYTGETKIESGTGLISGLMASGRVIVEAKGTLTGTGKLTGELTGPGRTAPGATLGVFRSGNLNLMSDSVFATEINGSAPGTSHDQLAVVGTVALNDATLEVSGTLAATNTSPIVLIANDGTDAVTGTFAGLAENAIVTVNGNAMSITYQGADGNDVALLPIKVSLAVSPRTVDEDGTGNLVYTFTRSAATPTPMTVNFNVAGSRGSATFATDYAVTGAASFSTSKGTVTFDAGSKTAVVTVDPTADNVVESDESVSLSLAAGTGYLVATTTPVTGYIKNDDSTVSVAVTPSLVTEDGATNMRYVFSRVGATTNALTVNFGVSGSATFGDDYSQTGADSFSTTAGSVTFAAGSNSAIVTLDPSVDAVFENNETAILTVTNGTGYSVGTRKAATGTIANENGVSVTVVTDRVTENGTPNLTYTFRREGPITSALTANITVTGTATRSGATAADYSLTGASVNPSTGMGTVTFAANARTATVTIDPTADATLEPDETIILSLQSGTGYNVTAMNVAMGTIENDDSLVSVTIISPDSMTEDDPGTLIYAFTRQGPLSLPLAVNYGLAGTARLNQSDFTISGVPAPTSATQGTFTFPAGASTVYLEVDPTADGILEPHETVILQVISNPTTPYSIGGTSATGTILDDDSAEVSVTATTLLIAENENADLVFTFVREGTVTQALTVNFTVGGEALLTSDYTQTGAATFTVNSGTITFAAGSNTAVLRLRVLADALTEGDESVEIALATGNGYVPAEPEIAVGTILDSVFGSVRSLMSALP